MPKVIVIGGGWSGCAAALTAVAAGCDVELFERTDMLLGTGLVGGIMRNNGRHTVAEETIAMGGGLLFHICDKVARHRNIAFPGHAHANLYDVSLIGPAVRHALLVAGVVIHFMTRAVDVEANGGRIKSIKASVFHVEDVTIGGDVFVETTGTAGSQGNCAKHGNGCSMCILRCPTYGPRTCVAAKIGVTEIIAGNMAGTFGSMSGSCKLHKRSLANDIVRRLDNDGVVIIPILEELKKGRPYPQGLPAIRTAGVHQQHRPFRYRARQAYDILLPVRDPATDSRF